jgi:tetratricopeptide (TPR) repeat protein
LEPDEAALVRSPLRQLLGLERPAEGDRNLLFPGWRLFIERMAAEAPVVLVFEDLQWADGGLLEFLDYLMEWSRNHPLFVLTLSRPEVGARRLPQARAMTSLSLEPLTDEEMAELVAGLAPGTPDDLVGRIVDAAEGVPLYAVETVRMLLDRGYLEREGDLLVAASDLGALEIPETLHALVAARLDALPDVERRLIEDAAVLGKTFTLSGLAAVSGSSETELEPLLASLVRREVLVLQTDPRSPERGQYVFVQAIVRTIAYETIGRRERKRRHLASARHLETLGGEDLAEVIAAHYVDAHRLAPDDEDAGEIRDQAVRTLLRAAERAGSLAAPGEAERLVTAAIELTDDERERATLLEQAGQLVLADGRPGESLERFDQAAALLERLGDQHGVARLNARRGESLFLNDRVDEAVALMEPAYAVLRDQEQDADLAALAAQFGRMLGFYGRTAESAEPLERALEISERQQLWHTLSHAMNTKGLMSLNDGRFREGHALLSGALRVALDHHEHEAAMRAYFNLAYSDELVDFHEGGYDDDGLALARRIGDRNWERAFLMHRSIAAFIHGDWDEALSRARLALEDATDQFARSALAIPVAAVLGFRGDPEAAAESMERSGMSPDSADAQVRVGWASAESLRLMAAGRWAEATAAARVWETGIDGMGVHHPSSKIAYGNWAESSFRSGDREAAASFVERIAALPPGLLTPVFDAQRRRIGALLGIYDDAAEELVAAAAGLRECKNRFLLMQVQADAAELLAATHPQQAAEALSEAGELATAMGATVILERLAAIQLPEAAAGA